jgi:hypothetical protein
MAQSRTYDRVPWEDRFNRPTAEQVREGLRAQPKRLFDLLRRSLRALDGAREVLAWHGDCWRWTLEYRTRQREEPLCVVVPSPADLQLAVPLSQDFVKSLRLDRMKRPVRDGIGLAAAPFDTRWGVWSIQAAAIVEDLIDLVELKLRYESREAG